MREIRDEKFISIVKGTGMRENCDIMFQISGIQPKIIIEGDLAMRISLLSVNAGITIAALNALITNVFSIMWCLSPLSTPITGGRSTFCGTRTANGGFLEFLYFQVIACGPRT